MNTEKKIYERTNYTCSQTMQFATNGIKWYSRELGVYMGRDSWSGWVECRKPHADFMEQCEELDIRFRLPKN